MGKKCFVWTKGFVVWYQLCGGCWVLLLEEGSAVLLCARLGKCGCLSHRKGKQNSLAWCEITCTAWFCSAVFCVRLCEEQMCCGVAFSINGMTEGFAFSLWSGCRAAGGDDAGCSSGCHAAF